MSTERDKFLTEAMGGCAQDEGFYRDSGYLCCSKCRNIVQGIRRDDQCLGLTKFSTWAGFGKLWEWAKEQDWFRHFQVDRHPYPGSESVYLKYINPDEFANAVYNYLKKEATK